MNKVNKFLLFIIIFGLWSSVFSLSEVYAANVNFTLSVWLKPEGSVASKAILVKDNEIRLVTDSNGKAACQIHNGTAWQTATVSNTVLSLNAWQHLECTYDGSYLRVFIDGMEQGKQAMTADVQNATSSLYLAKDASATYGYFQGIADDVRIYNYARTPEEVALDYNAGLAVKLGGSPGTTTPAVHQWRFEEGSGSTVADSRGQTPTFRDYDWVRPITVTNSTSTLTDYQVSVDLTSVDSLVDGLVGSWHMNASTSGNASGTTLVDSSGNSNNGTAYSPNGTGMQWTTGVETGALSFDGVDDYVNIGNKDLGFTNSMTIEAWFNTNKDTGYQEICYRDAQILFRTGISGGNEYIQYSIWDAGWHGSAIYMNVQNNVWHHMVGTYNGNILRVYHDGVEVYSLSYTGDIDSSSNIIRIGWNGIDGAYFSGLIDEPRIYNRALSQDEIKKSYCIGAKRLYDAGTWTLDKYQSAGCRGLTPTASYDWRDLRFSDINNTNLSYWLESDKKAWVKVPTLIGNSNSTIYMYYGNPSATSASNGTDTFIQFHGAATATYLDAAVTPSNSSLYYRTRIKTTANDMVFGISNVAAGNDEGLYFESYIPTNLIYLYTYNDGSYTPISETPHINDGNYHICEIKFLTGVSVKGYRDGDEIASGSTTNLPDEPMGLSILVGTPTQDWSFIGKYASPEPSVAVGSRLTADGNPVGQVNLTLSAGSGGANTTVSQMWTPSPDGSGQAGKYGSALEFDGTDDYASTTSALLGSSQFSYSTWFKLNRAPSSVNYLFSQGTDDPSVYIGTDNKVYVKADANQILQSYRGLTPVTDWHHLEVTADGTTIKLYLDGVLENSASYTGSSTDAVLYLGAEDSSPNYDFNGLIDDFRVYSYARDPDSVLVDYNAGFAAKLGGSPQASNPATHQWRLNEGVGSAAVDSRKMDVSLFGNYKNVRPITVTNSTSTLTDYQVSVDLTSADSLVDGLVGSWHFNAATSGSAQASTTIDSSGYSNNGTATGTAGTAISWTTGVETGALSFDGTDDYVDVGTGASLRITGPITLEAWVNTKEQIDENFIVGNLDSSARGYFLQLYNGKLRAGFRPSSGTDDIEESSKTMLLNEWYYVVATWNPTTKSIYINGEQVNSQASTKSDIYASTYTAMIGRRTYTADSYFDGTIDEPRIYNRALSQEEIKKSYCIGAKRLYDAGTWTKEKYQSAGCGSYRGQTPASYDWRDIRFSDINNTNLNYWLESDKKAWVKVPTLLGNSNSTIYMYYGNPSVSSASSGANTFEFFDDFEDGNIATGGTAPWTQVSGTTIETGGKIVMNENPEAITAPSTLTAGVWEIKLTIDTVNKSYYFRFIYQDESNYWIFFTDTGFWRLGKYVAAVWTTCINSVWTQALGTYTLKVTRDASGNFEIFVDGDSKGTYGPDAWLPSPDLIQLKIEGASAAAKWDDLRVRKYASPEPTVKVRSAKPSEPVGQVNLTLSAGSGGANTSVSQMWTNGIYGNGIEFDGTDDYLSAGNIGDVQTLSFWLAPFSLTQKVLEITATDNSTSTVELSNGKIDLEGTGWSSPKLYINGAEIGLDSNLQSVSTVRAYEWYHIEIVNGASISVSATNFGKVGSNYFTGLMDEIMSYDYSRTPDQVLIDYNAGFGIHFR